MTDVNLKPSQRAAIVGVVNPQSSSSAQSSGWIDATKFHNFMALIAVGAITSTGTFNAKLEQASDGSGTGAKDVTGKAITALADTDDSKQQVINLKQEDLDFANGFSFFRLTLTPATAASLLAGVVLGLDPRYGMASDNDATSVSEIV